MDFRQKIDNILAAREISSVSKLAKESGLGNTLEKAYQKNTELGPSTKQKFLHNMGISSNWWETGEGAIFITQGHKMGEVKETFYRDLIENNPEYSLLPKAVLKDYKIVPDNIINMITTTNEELKNALVSKYELIIQGLNEQNEQLRRRLGE